MGVFGGIKEAKFSEGGNYLKEGVHRLQVEACKHIKTLAGIDSFVVEFKILESSNPAHLPGSLCSQMIQIKPNTPALGNIKQFLMVALGKETTEDMITEEVLLYTVSEANPLKGRIVRADAHNIMTKKNTPFTKVRYMPDEG